MILLNQQSLAMRQESNIKKLLLAPCLLFTCITTSCNKEIKETMTNGDWLIELTNQAGIQFYDETEPYFINITKDSPYFTHVQAAVEWQVISPSLPFDIQQDLNKETLAYTLMNLLSFEESTSYNEIKDINDTIYPQQVKASIITGLLQLDKRNNFHPKEVISKQEALDYLKQVIDIINNRHFDETQSEFHLKDGIEEVVDTPLQVDTDDMHALFSNDADIAVGMFFAYEDTYFKITSIEQTDTGILASLENANIEDMMDDIHIQGQSDLRLDDAEIKDGNGNIVKEGTVDGYKLSLMSTTLLNHTFDINGFHVSIHGSTSALHAQISKQLQSGFDIYANANLDQLHVEYKWDKDDQDLHYGYLKTNFQTSENIGIKNGFNKDLYGDFSKLEPHDFLSTVQNLFQAKQNVVTDTITLCTIQIPVPNAPMISIALKLNLHINASGKAELSFTQDHTAGCEIRQGKFRTIYDMNKNITANIQAETGLTAGVNIALQAFQQSIMDAEVEAGAKGYFHSIAYLYHSDGKAEPFDIDISPDIFDELASTNQDVKMCTELNAYWLCNVRFNSANTLAGRFGFGRSLPILNEKNAPIFPKGKQIYENWMAVDHCSCKDRQKPLEHDPIQVRKKITLKDYSLIISLHGRKRIEITGLPENYTVQDLIYQSQDESIAVVDHNGNVTGMKPGGTDIMIQTKDKKHYIHCHILVSEKSSV